MLTYKCNSCETDYEAQIMGSRFTYMRGNKVVTLNNEDDDCQSCQEKIITEMRNAKQKIKSETVKVVD